MEEYKYALDICEKMIDRLQRELYSNNSMLSAVSSAYDALSTKEQENYKIKRAQLNNLLKFRTQLLDAAMNAMSENGIGDQNPIMLGVAEGFDFSL